MYHQQLSYCMTQYVEKDPRLAFEVVTSMLKFWPVSLTRLAMLPDLSIDPSVPVAFGR